MQAPSYRLGRAPDHLTDCAAALRWAAHSAAARELLGPLVGGGGGIGGPGGGPGDGDGFAGLFLSGHSAGGNIAALLALGLASGTGAGAVALAANGIAVGGAAEGVAAGGGGGGEGEGGGAGGGVVAAAAAGAGAAPATPSSHRRLRLLPLRLRGLVCISGVMSLFQPLGHAYGQRWKTALFFKGYVQGTFGESPDLVTCAAHSPNSVLQAVLGDPAPRRDEAASPHHHPVERRKQPCPVRQRINSLLERHRGASAAAPPVPPAPPAPAVPPAPPPVTPVSAAEAPRAVAGERAAAVAACMPPVLVLSAAWDLGLEVGAARFAVLLRRCGVRTDFAMVNGAHHASICWVEDSFQAVDDWCRAAMQRERCCTDILTCNA